MFSTDIRMPVLSATPDSFDEASGVVALPAEWGMNNHDVGTEPARGLG